MAARKITIQSRAKLNLILKVLGTRPDGFHNIQSVFQSIDLADEISFSLKSGGNGITIISSNSDIPLGSDNLITKAYNKLAEIKDIPEGTGVLCELEKNIPPGSGMGGGSSNCASSLIALNELLETGLKLTELKSIGETLGSDIPYFFSGGTCFVHGRGENVEMLSFLSDCAFIVVTPSVHVDTSDAYELLDESRNSTENEIRSENNTLEMQNLLSQAILDGDIASFFHNDFEKPVFEKYPIISDLKSRLSNLGPVSLMTGSGSSVFVYFRSSDDAFKALENYTPLEGEKVSLTRPTQQAFELYG